MAESVGKDMLTDTRTRLQTAGDRWDAEASGAGKVEAAVLRGETPAPVDESAGPMSMEEREMRAWSLVAAAVQLAIRAKTMQGAERAQALSAAYQKYSEALKLKPDHSAAYSNWSVTLSDEADGLSGDERDAKLAEAIDMARQAKAISGVPNYNLACALSLSGYVSEVLDELEACEQHDTLPPLSHLATDSDLDPLHDEPRFKALLERLESKEVAPAGDR